MLVGVRCVACDSTGGPVCPACAAGVRPIGEVEVGELDRAWALMAYEGPARRLVGRLKYDNRRAALGVLAAAMAHLLPPDEVGAIDVITWLPATPSHRRQRGYDQAELLARRTARVVGRPCRGLLHRAPDRPQTGLDRVERLAGPLVGPRRSSPPTVLLVDDVLTTGGSLGAGARALRGGGARRVLGLVVAATPLGG